MKLVNRILTIAGMVWLLAQHPNTTLSQKFKYALPKYLTSPSPGFCAPFTAMVEALTGGHFIGHTKPTMGEATALGLFERFERFFGSDRQYYLGMSLEPPVIAWVRN